MYFLLAHHISEAWTGEAGRRSFNTLEDAFIEMEIWAEYGIDSYCSEVHHIGIYNESGQIIFQWDWKNKKSKSVTEK
jgi:hypothetical protein